MIKARKGKVKLSGIAPMLLSEFSTITMAIIEALVQKEGMDRDDAVTVVEYAFENGLLTKEELVKKALAKIDEINKEENEHE